MTNTELTANLLNAFGLPAGATRDLVEPGVEHYVDTIRRDLIAVRDDITRMLDDFENARSIPTMNPGYSGTASSRIESAMVAANSLRAVLEVAGRMSHQAAV